MPSNSITPPYTPRQKSEISRVVFTKKFLDVLSPASSASGQWTWHYDIQVPGLAIGVGPSGIKSFYLVRKVNRQSRRFLLGKYPTVELNTARTMARDFNAKLAQGIDPKAAAKSGMTFAELFKKFMTDYSYRRNRTAEMSVKAYDRYLATDRYGVNLGSKLVDDITDTHIQTIFNGVSEHAPIHANRVLALIRCIFNRAITWKIRTSDNPCKGIERNKEKSRERRVSSFEIPYLFRSLDYELNDTLRDFIYVALFTGARRGNVLPMRWDEIDFDACFWQIALTKNGTPQTVPLVPTLIEILKVRRTKVASEWVFPANSKTGHYMEPKKAWKTLLERATALRLVDHLAKHYKWPDSEKQIAIGNVVAAPLAGFTTYSEMAEEARISLKPLDMRDIRVHDLRRTMGSWQADLNTSLAIIGRTLNHQSPQSTKVYARLSLDPVREAMEAATSAMLLHHKPMPQASTSQARTK
nr:site-specific integrase [uncultured Rhodoferax sp.]